MAGSPITEEIYRQFGYFSLKERSNDRAYKYVNIMEQLKEDVREILERQYQATDEVIHFTCPPNKLEKDRNEQRRLIRIKHIYNPLEDYWEYHKRYKPKCPVQISVLFVGMNPAPSAPFGIPFPDEYALRYWNIRVGESCPSGERFWKLIAKLLREIDRNMKHFLEHCFVINCCPLYFVGDVNPEDLCVYPVGDTNIALDSIIDSDLDPDHYVRQLLKKSDEALTSAINLINPELIIPIGWYAWNKVRGLKINRAIDIGKYIPHPSGKNIEDEKKWMDNAMRILSDNGVDEMLGKSNRKEDGWSEWKIVARPREKMSPVPDGYEPMPDYHNGMRATLTEMRQWWAHLNNGVYELEVPELGSVYLGMTSSRNKRQSLISKVRAHTRSDSSTFKNLVSVLENGNWLRARVLPCDEIDEPEIVECMSRQRFYPWRDIPD